jgi:hypothetical protein
MKEIPLTHHKIALVDDEDYERLIKHKWHARKDRNTFYASRTVMIEGKKTTVQLHREVLRLTFGDGIEVDHRNRNGLDNQKENLRIATSSLNSYNRKMQHNNTSGFRGVSWHSRDQVWQAYIKLRGKRINLGYHNDILLAAVAYDYAARKYYGNDAILNFPEG